MLHNVYLYGSLGEKYGEHHIFDIENAPQAAKALCANFKSFFNDFKDGLYQVIIGDRNNGTNIDEDTMGINIGHKKDVHIIPVVRGSGGGNEGGVIKTVLGVALIAGAFVASAFLSPTAASFLFNIGLALTFAGVATLLTPSPEVSDYETRETPDRRASFLFNGPRNRGTEGSAVPIVYGRIRTGSVVVSAGIQTEQI